MLPSQTEVLLLCPDSFKPCSCSSVILCPCSFSRLPPFICLCPWAVLRDTGCGLGSWLPHTGPMTLGRQ